MSARPTTWLFIAVATAVAGLAFAIGQSQAGLGLPVALFLSIIWTIFAQQRWGKNNG